MKTLKIFVIRRMLRQRMGAKPEIRVENGDDLSTFSFLRQYSRRYSAPLSSISPYIRHVPEASFVPPRACSSKVSEDGCRTCVYSGIDLSTCSKPLPICNHLLFPSWLAWVVPVPKRRNCLSWQGVILSWE